MGKPNLTTNPCGNYSEKVYNFLLGYLGIFYLGNIFPLTFLDPGTTISL